MASADEPLVDGVSGASLTEVLDRVLNKGVVVSGELTLSVAGIDLLYLGLQAVLTSVETVSQQRVPPATGQA